LPCGKVSGLIFIGAGRNEIERYEWEKTKIFYPYCPHFGMEDEKWKRNNLFRRVKCK
jgi:hypothetical protein